jgi:hypothetical protein
MGKQPLHPSSHFARSCLIILPDAVERNLAASWSPNPSSVLVRSCHRRWPGALRVFSFATWHPEQWLLVNELELRLCTEP